MAAHSILSRSGCKSGACRLLLARCCIDLKQYSEAEEFLLSFSCDPDSEPKSNVVTTALKETELINEFGDSAAFVSQLLGLISVKTERSARAIKYYGISLKLNPFLWSSYEALIHLGQKVDLPKTFNVSDVDFSMCHGSNALVNLWNNSVRVPSTSDPASDLPSQTIPLKDCNFEISSPFAVIKPASIEGAIDVFTPVNNNWNNINHAAPIKQVPDNIKSAKKSYLSTQNSSITADLFTLRADTPLGVTLRSTMGGFPLTDQKTPTDSNEINPLKAPEKMKLPPRAARKQSRPRPDVIRTRSTKGNIFSMSSNIHHDVPRPPTQVSQPDGQQLLRRSTRLGNSSSSVKENTSKPAPNQENKTSLNNNLPKKPRRSSSTVTSDHLIMNENNKTIQDSPKVSDDDLIQAALKMQRASAEGIMNLLQTLASAANFSSQFESQKAIQVLLTLPPKHLKSGYVQSALGKCYFELAQYTQAIKYYEESRRLEPHRMSGLEYYTTALWHQQQEVKLSMLSQELIELDQNCPQTWCVAGNCFSLQKEHETAIKFLQRAIQVDPDFTYAYTLLGHELVLTEEMDHAMACYRSAIRIDPRHYNAWYGIASICYKQEKFQQAEIHYRKAMEINPNNSTLRCHLAVVLHALKKVDQSLEVLDEAIKMDPENVLCKFHRASFYCSAERHQEALTELEALRILAPKESLVYFLIGKVNFIFHV